MPPHRKIPRTNEQKLQYVADLVVKTAGRYGLPIHEVGVPPMCVADGDNDCDSHGRVISCLACGFNRCQICSDRLDYLTLWTGRCKAHQTVPHRPHVALVHALLEGDGGEAPEEQVFPISKGRATAEAVKPPTPISKGKARATTEAVSPPAPTKRSKTSSSADGAGASGIPRQQPPALPVAQAMPIAAPAMMMSPQINIAIAPLEEFRVETTSTRVRRVGNGIMGGLRFEVTVKLVLGQVVGQV